MGGAEGGDIPVVGGDTPVLRVVGKPQCWERGHPHIEGGGNTPGGQGLRFSKAAPVPVGAVSALGKRYRFHG